MPFAGAANDSESVFVCLSAVNNLRRARIDNRSPLLFLSSLFCCRIFVFLVWLFAFGSRGGGEYTYACILQSDGG